MRNLNPNNRRVKTLRALALYALAVLVVAGAVSFPAQALFHQLGWFADKPWMKFFSRCASLAAVAFLWPLLCALGMSSWAGIGLRAPLLTAVLRAAGGWITAFGGTMLLGMAAVMAGNRVWETGRGAGFGSPLLVGMAVGIFEEVFFRGLIFGALRREWGAAWALWISSVFYAALHFVGAPPKSVMGVLPALLSLTLFGALLAWCYARSGSLYLSIGVHAGCVTALKWWAELTDSGAAGMEWLFGSGRFKLVNGLAALPMLLLFWIALRALDRAFRVSHVDDAGKLGPGGAGPGLSR
jgi:hypothetical protein